MCIYDDIFHWEGWGGKLKLASGQCRLRIYDLEKGQTGRLPHLKRYVVVVSDVEQSPLSVRSCAGHIATCVVRRFHLDPHRMLYVEHYPPSRYGPRQEHVIPEKFDAVDFQWHQDRAIQPKWRPLRPPLLEAVRSLLQSGNSGQKI